MYEIIIRDYINKLTEDDIIQYSKRKNISLNDDDMQKIIGENFIGEILMI